jgi:hypothetical protein
MLLSLPLAWVMRSHAVAIFYLMAIAIWSVNQTHHVEAWQDSALLYPVLVMGLAPFWPGWPPQWRLSPSLQWMLTLSLAVGLSAAASTSALLHTGERYGHFPVYFWLWVFTAAAMFLLPVKPAAIDDTRRHDPHVTLNGFFLLFVGFQMTFGSSSREVLPGLRTALEVPWAWGCLALVGIFAVPAIRQQRWGLVGVTALILTPILTLMLGPCADQVLPWLMTLHLLVIGVLLIVLDLTGRRGAPRLGATLICLLIMARMFESELSLLVKGLVFIAVGVAFLAFNIFMSRLARQKQLPQP